MIHQQPTTIVLENNLCYVDFASFILLSSTTTEMFLKSKNKLRKSFVSYTQLQHSHGSQYHRYALKLNIF